MATVTLPASTVAVTINYPAETSIAFATPPVVVAEVHLPGYLLDIVINWLAYGGVLAAALGPGDEGRGSVALGLGYGPQGRNSHLPGAFEVVKAQEAAEARVAAAVGRQFEALRRAESVISPASSAALDLAETATELTEPGDLYEPGTEAPRAYQRIYQRTNFGAEEAGSEGDESDEGDDEDAECEDN
ncbi:hypothetical protein MY3296_007849 [Beauveria thailandica]